MKRLLSTIMLLLALTVGTWAQNTLPGRFSVSDTKQVYFSKGNLQYIGTPAAGYNTNGSSYGNHGLYNSTTQ